MLIRKVMHYTFPKFIFGLFFVYVLLLGVFNISVFIFKNDIEKIVAKALNAQKATIGNISNLPGVFISCADFSIDISDSFLLKIEGVYLHYNLLEFFISKPEKIIKEVQINNILFKGHRADIAEYIEKMKHKYQKVDFQIEQSNQHDLFNQDLSKNESSKPDIITTINNLEFIVKVHQIEIIINTLTEFWHKVFLNSINVKMKNGAVNWDLDLDIYSEWSNSVFLFSTSTITKGILSNFNDLTGNISFDIEKFNLGGLPLVDNELSLKLSFTNNKAYLEGMNYDQNKILLETKTNFQLSIDRSFDIMYEDFEEYNLLDYVFDKGVWRFKSKINYHDTLSLDVSLKSEKYPNHGLNISARTLDKKNEYHIDLELNTHFFGSIRGDLILPIQEGLYPLPKGNLLLEDVRFILAGLVFSGKAILDPVPGANKLNITGYNVAMNRGLIGNTAVTFDFTSAKTVFIYPKNISNSAVSVYAELGNAVQVNLHALDVNGHFISENIKIPIFGLKESRYKGMIDLFKEKRSSNISLVADVKGYLDDEEQIKILLNLNDTRINVPIFYFVGQDLLINGYVDIITERSNTYVNIDAAATFRKNDPIPIEMNIDIQKSNVNVVGFVDNLIPLSVKSDSIKTFFTMDFKKYPLNKLSLTGNLSAQLLMDFSPTGIVRFGVHHGKWDIDSRLFSIDFDCFGNPDRLNTSYMKLGFDNDILQADGYFSFFESHTEGAFRFKRGGGLQFQIERYTVKSRLDIRKLVIDNFLNMKIFEPVSFLKNNSTETIVADLDVTAFGLWTNLDYKGSLVLTSLNSNSFILAIPDFYKKNDTYSFSNIHLQHSLINLDANLLITNNNQALDLKVGGSMSMMQNFVKTDFSINLTNDLKYSKMIYDIPNLYVFSKKPMKLKGEIIRSESDYLFLSDYSEFGVLGVISQKNNQLTWQGMFIEDSLKIVTKGEIKNNQIFTALNLEVDLSKVNISGNIKKLDGKLAFDSIVEGSLNNPIINGNLLLDNTMLSLKSLRNELSIPGKVNITIQTNLIQFPKIPILANKGGGRFTFDGIVFIQDQSIANADLHFYSDHPNRKKSSLNWNLSVPYLTIKGKTFINDITLNGTIDQMILSATIDTENLNLGLELGDTINEIKSNSVNADHINPFLALLAFLDLNIKVNMLNRTRFINQLFDLNFEQSELISIEGNIADNSLFINGYLNISKGTVYYLANNLKVNTGYIQFSGEKGDPYPYLSISTEITERTFQNESIDIYVDFKGKIPNIELSHISSSPFKPISELYALLGVGGNSAISSVGASKSSQNIFTSSIGVAENAFFTSPLSKQIRKLLPFIDTFNIKTDVLGSVSRSLSQGIPISGFSILDGSELEVGQYLPGMKGLQLKYNLRLESPENSALNSAMTLDRVHKGSLEWTYLLPMQTQLGIGASVLGEEKMQQLNQQTVEVLGEFSLRKRF